MGDLIRGSSGCRDAPCFLSKMFGNILQNVNAKDINKAGHSDISRKLSSYHIALFTLNP